MRNKSGAEAPKDRTQTKEASPGQMVLFTAIAGIALVASIVWVVKSKPDSANAFIWVGVLLLFFLALLAGTLTTFANRRLVRVMKAPPAAGTPVTQAGGALVMSAGAPLVAEGGPAERSGPLPPPLEMHIFDARTAAGLSPAVAARVGRANRNLAESVRLLRQGVWFMVGSCAVLMILALAAGNLVLPIGTVVVGLLLFPVARFARTIGEFSDLGEAATYYFWRATNAALFPIAGVLALLYIGVALIMGIGGQPHVAVNLGQSARVVLPPAWVVWCDRLLILVAIAAPVVYRLRLRGAARAVRQSVLADRPLKLLYLWVFAPVQSQGTAESDISPAWHFAGPVQMLRGSDFMADIRWTIPILTGRTDRYVLETPQEVAAALKSLRMAPNGWGMYPTNTMLCGDSVWQLALEAVLADADAVLMNLRNFTRERRGCAYELGQLVDHLPTRRWLLLVDETTDMDYLREALAEAWASMAPGSPNRGADVAPVQVFRLSKIEVTKRNLLSRAHRGKDAAAPLTDGQAEVNRMFEILCQAAMAA